MPRSLAQPLTLGSVRLETNLLLAPIAGYCDLAYRIVCREIGGVGLACTDLLSPQGLLRGTRTSLDLARTHDLDRPIGMQLYGSDPAIMADGARWAQDHGATVIDINMGCPVDKITKKDGGSRLMCDPARARRIVEAVVGAVSVPVTAKMRLGWAEGAPPTAPDLARDLIAAGVVGVTVHGRTAEQKFRGSPSLEGIARVVEAVAGRVPVIGNGDVNEPEDAERMIRATGCDGVMIGRGALSAPWLFRQTWHHLLRTDGRAPPEPSPPSERERIGYIRRYFLLMLGFRDEHYAMDQIRRRISWFGRRLGGVDERGRPRGCRILKEAIRTSGTPGDVLRILAQHEAGLRSVQPADAGAYRAG